MWWSRILRINNRYWSVLACLVICLTCTCGTDSCCFNKQSPKWVTIPGLDLSIYKVNSLTFSTHRLLLYQRSQSSGFSKWKQPCSKLVTFFCVSCCFSLKFVPFSVLVHYPKVAFQQMFTVDLDFWEYWFLEQVHKIFAWARPSVCTIITQFRIPSDTCWLFTLSKSAQKVFFGSFWCHFSVVVQSTGHTETLCS